MSASAGQEIVMGSRACRKCKYELRGLRIGGNCPECGEPIRSRPKKFNAREGTLTDADPHYVSTLRWGFVAMSVGIVLAILGAVSGTFSFGAGLVGSVLASLAWCGGVLLISNPRPPEFDQLGDKVLDNPKMRLLVRAAGAVWVLYTLVGGGYEALRIAGLNGGGNGLLEGVMLVLTVLTGIGAYLSLIPVCIFVSDMAFWMSDDAGGWRLRGAAWTMAVVGTVNLLFTGLVVAGVSWLGFFTVWLSIIVFIATVVFGLSVLGCAKMAGYTLRYQAEIEGRAERISERIRAKTEHRGGMIGHDMDCRECGYNLRGLPNGGSCPECGLSYADITPPPLRPRDKPWDPADHEALAVDESSAALPIIARVPSIGKDSVRGARGDRQQIPPVDDDSPIPLAMGDADQDLPEDMQDVGAGEGVALTDADADDGSIPLADDDGDEGDRKA
jgi:predicted Zn-ribbon and HTH transcriptional regulator